MKYRKLLFFAVLFGLILTLKTTADAAEGSVEEQGIYSDESGSADSADNEELYSDESGSADDPDAEERSADDSESADSEDTGDGDPKNGADQDEADRTETEQSSHEHFYTSVITKEPTCIQSGERTYTCECGNSYTEIVEASGHVPAEPVKENEILSDGAVPGTVDLIVYCEACGEELSRESKEFEAVPLASVEIKYDKKKYTGTARTQSGTTVVTAVVDGQSVVLDGKTDYRITYKNNINVGTATMTIQGKGYYTGTLTKEFQITPVSLRSAVLSCTSKQYTGQPRTQTKSTTVKAVVNGSPKILKYGTDYKITYKNNINAGTATMIIQGKGNYSGKLTKTFKITPVSLEFAELKYSTKKYTGEPITQTKTTKVYALPGGIKTLLEKGRDYSVTYKNNINSGTATMIIKGAGNYKGTIRKTFRIAADWDDKKTSTGSLFPTQYERLKNNQPINTNDPTGTVFSQFAPRINGSFIIPGIKQTHIVAQNGNHTVCKDMIVQGMCAAKDYMILSAYCHDGAHGSVLYILKNGKYQETINLIRSDGSPFRNHVGGLTYLNGNIYIAGDYDLCVYSVKLSDIVSTLGKQDAVRMKVNTAFQTLHNASFLTAYNNSIYVGTFYQNEYSQPTRNSTMLAYDPSTGSVKSNILTLPENTIQGAAFVKNGGNTFLLLSSSFGRMNTSRLLSVKLNGSNTTTTYKSMLLPNMSENIAVRGDTLYVNFESAAKEYRSGAFQESIRPLDRVIGMDYRMLVQ